MPTLTLNILEMTRKKTGYFAYFPATPEGERWGIEVLGAGFASIAAGGAYPPAGHPRDHLFDHRKGRVLQALQVLCLSAGGGTFRSASVGRQKVSAGTVFLLFPGEWHTYRPDPATGWTEHWIELDGWVPRQLIRGAVLDKSRCVLRGVGDAGVESAFQEVHSMLDGPRERTMPALCSAAYRLLALCADLPNLDDARVDHLKKMKLAQHRLASPGERPDLEALAAELGWGYSYFRRVFKNQTGLSPWQYHLRSRLSHARRLLAASDRTLDSIAESSGFASAFHLSAAFKKAFGESPREWRKSVAGRPR
jgi:AraC-like DNA-binding protein